jgi:hypothetical protein
LLSTLRVASAKALPIALFGIVCLLGASPARAAASPCEESAAIAVLPSPLSPWKGAPLHVLFAAEKPFAGELILIAPDGGAAATTRDRKGGPPYFWFAEIANPAAGTWHAKLIRDGATGECATITRDIVVSESKPPAPHGTASSVWPIHAAWDRATENLFSAWIEKLFDAPLNADLSWKTWNDVLRDRSRNFLFDYLGAGEDGAVGRVRPDCADFVYFLRAYFAYKIGLPFAYSNCSRGFGGSPPKCYQWFDIEHPGRTRPSPPSEQKAEATATPAATPAPAPNLLQQMFPQQSAAAESEPAPGVAAPAAKRPAAPSSFGAYLRDVGDVVQSGAVRVSATDDNTDFYTVPLTQDALRPGTVYADPYGHVMMLVRLVPEADGAPGVFLAVDAEPDGTVTRKRFWRGNFLFVHEPALGSPGFKRFRPIVREANGGLRRLTNVEIAKNPQYGDFSLEQSKLDGEAFYDRMDEVMSPQPLDPLRAMTDAITSLEEQVKTRAVAVENGRKYQNSGKGEAEMPNGAAIFETTGAWEDFSTPARDFRLLIAVDVVRGFPDRVARRPERYAIPSGKNIAEVKAELQSALASVLAARKFSYTRSDGSPWTLMLKDVVDREPNLEMAYNPNDCVELRWAAPEGSEEVATCKRHAPEAQRAKMIGYRNWFRDRHWPSHA